MHSVHRNPSQLKHGQFFVNVYPGERVRFCCQRDQDNVTLCHRVTSTHRLCLKLRYTQFFCQHILKMEGLGVALALPGVIELCLK